MLKAEPCRAVISDLSVESIITATTKPELKKDTYIYVKVKNNGPETIPAATLNDISYTFDQFDIKYDSYSVPGNGLPAGGEFTYAFYGQFTGIKAIKLRFSIDVHERIEETEEGRKNNTKETEVYIYGHDLQVTSIALTPAKPIWDQDCIVTVTLKNNGTENIYTMTGLETYKYNFGSDFVVEKSAPASPSIGSPVKPDEYMQFVFEGEFMKPGEKTVYFSIDTADELVEGSEANNTLEAKLSIADYNEVDFLMEDIAPSMADPTVDESVTLNFLIKNNNAASFTTEEGLDSQDLIVELSGFNSTGRKIYRELTGPSGVYYAEGFPTAGSALDSGKHFKISYTGNFAKTGINNVCLEIDRRNKIGESSEKNNKYCEDIMVYSNASERDTLKITDVKSSFVSSTETKITFSTDKTAQGKIGYREIIHLDDLSIDGASGATAHSITLSGLQKDKSYTYRVLAVKNAVVKTTEYFTFKTPKDNNPLFTAQPSVSIDYASSTAAIKWSVNLISSGAVYYKKSSDINYIEVGSGITDTGHSAFLKDLATTTYDYYVISTSTLGTAVLSNKAQFNVIKPSIPANNNQPANINPNAIATTSEEKISIKNKNLYSSLKGKIILEVEKNGEAYYVNPKSEEMYYLGRPDDAFSVMREQGAGITTANLEKIQIGLSDLSGSDADGDGLSDIFEDAVGSDKGKKDSDSDNFEDKAELSGGYKPNGAGKYAIDKKFSESQKGKIFLQVENKGEAWYVNPADGKRYFLGRPNDAFNIMRNLGLGISNNNFDSLK